MTKSILDLEMQPNDADAKTIREYLLALLKTLWTEGEGFSGKRPFGNSGWEYELYLALVKGGVVKGKIDEDGFVESVDEANAFKLISTAIDDLLKDKTKE